MEIGLTLTAGSQAANVSLNVDAHSELMSAYPWGSTKPDQTTFNLPDKASFNSKQLVFTDTGTPPVANAPAQDYAAIVGATGLTPASGKTGADFAANVSQPFNERSSLNQAWGTYGVLWPVVNQQLTVDQVTLNGSAAHYAVRDTSAGREVMVSTPCRGQTWRVQVVAG